MMGQMSWILLVGRRLTRRTRSPWGRRTIPLMAYCQTLIGIVFWVVILFVLTIVDHLLFHQVFVMAPFIWESK